MPTLAPDTSLTAADRCDRCGARAYLRVVLSGGGDLLFCAHHAGKYEEKLREVAADFQDERFTLSSTPANAPAEER